MSFTYTATLPVREETVLYVSSLLHAGRRRRGTRTGTRALGCFKQAVLVIRWFLDGTRVSQLARDSHIGESTSYLWWSGKHHNHGDNVPVITVPDGWPIWTSEVRPGREHDTTAVRTHTEILTSLVEAGADLRTLWDLGYEGESDTITVAFKKPKHGELSAVQKQFDGVHNGIRAVGERGNSLLKMTFRALRNVSLDRGGSARSSPPRWCCCTTTTAAPHDRAQ